MGVGVHACACVRAWPCVCLRVSVRMCVYACKHVHACLRSCMGRRACALECMHHARLLMLLLASYQVAIVCHRYDDCGKSGFGVADLVGNVWQYISTFADDHTRSVLLKGIGRSRRSDCR